MGSRDVVTILTRIQQNSCLAENLRMDRFGSRADWTVAFSESLAHHQ
jgi:hypothetical protein